MRDFGELNGLSSVTLQVLKGFDDTGQPLVGTGSEPTGQPSKSLISLSLEDVGCELATTSLEGSNHVLVLGRIQPALPTADVDGERLVLEAEKEIVLRCGKSSITLTADGRVNVKGKQLLSRADGQNRVQGASVQLN